MNLHSVISLVTSFLTSLTSQLCNLCMKWRTKMIFLAFLQLSTTQRWVLSRSEALKSTQIHGFNCHLKYEISEKLPQFSLPNTKLLKSLQLSTKRSNHDKTYAQTINIKKFWGRKKTSSEWIASLKLLHESTSDRKLNERLSERESC